MRTMPLLFESIKLKDGVFHNLAEHSQRMNRSRADLLKTSNEINLADQLTVPKDFSAGLYKCRVLYDTEITSIEFENYEPRSVGKVSAIVCDEIEYAYKYSDRSVLNMVFSRRAPGVDDILIIKNGFFTDSTYANLVFLLKDKWITPRTPLLPGTKRAFLLKAGLVEEDDIHVSKIDKFKGVSLINAMLDPGDIWVPRDSIQM